MSCIFCNNSNEELVIKNDIYKILKDMIGAVLALSSVFLVHA